MIEVATIATVEVVVVVRGGGVAVFPALYGTNIGCQTKKSKRLPWGVWFDLGVHLPDRVPPELRNFLIIRDETDFPFFLYS